MNDLKPTYTHILCSNLFRLLLFAVIFTGSFFFLLYQLCGYFLNRILDTFGYSFLTTKNVNIILHSPFTIMLLLFIFILAVIFIIFEANVFLIVFRASYINRRLSIFDMLYFAILNIKRLHKRKNLASYFLLGYVFITCSLFSTYCLGLLTNDNNFFIQLIHINIDNRLSFYFIIIGLILLSALFSFAPMYISFENTSFFKGLYFSLLYWKKHFLSFTLRFLSLNFFIILGLFILFILGNLISVSFVKYNSPIDAALSQALINSDKITYFLLFSCSIISPLLNICLFVYLFYHKSKDRRSIIIFPNRTLTNKYDLCIAILCSIIFLLLITNTIYHYKDPHLPLILTDHSTCITSHRGDSYEAPENTIPAIEAAIDNLSDYCEIDVRETADGVMVLLHDSTLTRTTGLDMRVADTTYEEISTLDAGSWFNRIYSGTRIPTFIDVLDYCKQENIKLNIDLKYNTKTPNLATDVVNAIELYDMENNCIISSTSTRILLEVNALNPNITTGKIISDNYTNTFNETYVDFYSLYSSIVTKSKVDMIHANGKAVHVWTVNTPLELTRCQRLGVDNVITDMPTTAREVFYKNRGTTLLDEYIINTLQDD